MGYGPAALFELPRILMSDGPPGKAALQRKRPPPLPGRRPFIVGGARR